MKIHITILFILIFTISCTTEPESELSVNNLNTVINEDLQEEVKLTYEDGSPKLIMFFQMVDNQKRIYSIKMYDQDTKQYFEGIYKYGITEHTLDNAFASAKNEEPSIPDGIYKRYYSGKLDSEGLIENNKEHGLHTYYYSDQKVYKQITYHYGQIVDKKFYDINGKEYEEILPG